MSVDEIFEWVDDKFSAGAFMEVDEALLALKLEKMDIDTMITWLTATLCAKSKLSNRTSLFNHLKSVSDDELLWKGLE